MRNGTRKFPSQISLSCHYPRWCPKVITAAADARPRRNQRANKIIEAKKRTIKVETQAKIKLNGELITNDLGAKTTSMVVCRASHIHRPIYTIPSTYTHSIDNLYLTHMYRYTYSST